MSLNISDYTIIKLIQATFYQGNVRYDPSRGLQCSCMSLICQLLGYCLELLVSWITPGILDCILGKGGQLIKFIGKFRYLEVEDLP